MKARTKKQLEKDATRVAQLATQGNPVSVLKLGQVHKFALAQLLAGESEASAVLNTAAYIRSLES